MEYPGPLVAEALDALESTIDTLVALRPRPTFEGEPGRGQFRFEPRDSQLVQILKGVRVVSGLRAATHLIAARHLQEASCILRVVADALRDIDVLDEAHQSGDAKAYHQAMVDQFFASDDSARIREAGTGSLKPLPRVGRKKKHASLQRMFETVAPGRNFVSDLEKIDAVLDGYVHSGYAQSLELYSSTGRTGRFHMRGISSPERLTQVARWAAMFVHHALNTVAKIAIDAGLANRREKLVDVRKRLEVSAEYPQPPFDR